MNLTPAHRVVFDTNTLVSALLLPASITSPPPLVVVCPSLTLQRPPCGPQLLRAFPPYGGLVCPRRSGRVRSVQAHWRSGSPPRVGEGLADYMPVFESGRSAVALWRRAGQTLGMQVCSRMRERSSCRPMDRVGAAHRSARRHALDCWSLSLPLFSALLSRDGLQTLSCSQVREGLGGEGRPTRTDIRASLGQMASIEPAGGTACCIVRGSSG